MLAWLAATCHRTLESSGDRRLRADRGTDRCFRFSNTDDLMPTTWQYHLLKKWNLNNLTTKMFHVTTDKWLVGWSLSVLSSTTWATLHRWSG